MKWTVSIALSACVVAAAGCNPSKKPASATAASSPLSAGVLSVPTAPAAQYTPPSVPQPVVYDAPQVQPAPQPAPEPAAVAPAPQLAADTLPDPAPASPAPAPAAQRALRTSAVRTASARHGSLAGSKYTIRKGDSLWSIALNKYGNGNKWKAIARANPKVNPNHILAGTTIVLP